MELMPAVYAAIEAVAEGKANEIDVDHRVTQEDGSEETIVVCVRREVRPMVLPPAE